LSRAAKLAGDRLQTDAASEPAVKIVATFPEDSHPPITYPIALTKTSTNPDARAFLSYVRSPAGKAGV